MVLKDVVGLLCCILVYVCVIYADFAFVIHLLVPFANGTLALILAIIFNLSLAMVLISHAKATLSDPGYVPLPEARIDFSDRDSLQGRDDDWSICQVVRKTLANIAFRTILESNFSVAKCGVLQGPIIVEFANAVYVKWIITARGSTLALASGIKSFSFYFFFILYFARCWHALLLLFTGKLCGKVVLL